MSDFNLEPRAALAPESRYFSRVLAGQCHELANALNIAHQLCGLHEDTLPYACEGGAGVLEKLASVAQRIDSQIERCSAIVRSLGRFAHSVDEPMMACDAREIVERAAFFAARQARLRQTELRAVVPEGDVRAIYCSPFRLQQAIHAGIELLLEGIAESRRITATLALDAAGVAIAIASGDPFPCDAAAVGRLAEVAGLVQAAGGEMRRPPEGGSCLMFFIPYAHAVEVPDVY